MTATHPHPQYGLRAAQISWLLLIVLTLIWDGLYAPLHTGRWLLFIKLLPLMLPLRGILSGRIYTYQYCSMLIMMFFTEGIMRLSDKSHISKLFAATETALSIIFFISCLIYLKQFKSTKTDGK